jgi:hypothetical protein
MNGNEFAPKVTQTVHLIFYYIMTKSVLVSMLRQGQTGNEILSILDVIANGENDAVTETVSAQPTLQEIEF